MGGLPILWVNVTVYMTEIFTPNWRYSYQVAMQIPIKDLIFTAIIYYSRTWTQIHLWTGILAGCALPLFALVPESARWLAMNNKEEEALQILLKIGKINGRCLLKAEHESLKVFCRSRSRSTKSTALNSALRSFF